MATIRQYENGRWQAIVRRNGYPVLSKTFGNRSEAHGWARLLESEMDRGIFCDRSEAERTTLASLFDRYGEEVTPRKKSARRELLRLKLLKARLGQLSPANLQSKHIAAFRDQRLREGKAGATVLKELTPSRMCWTPGFAIGACRLL